MQGKFYCTCFSRAKNYKEIPIQLKMLGVRFKKFNLPPDWSHSSALSPSPQLWKEFQELKNRGIWNQDTFIEFYQPRFNIEMTNSEEARRDFEFIIWHLRNGHNVLFSCYCNDFRVCHRSIIAHYVSNLGFEIDLQ
ncbi:hypothetical protein LIS04_212 [Listeria phage LIS04]|nr:hypothetical protein LIS04_212 [Listeria phage LIS04]